MTLPITINGRFLTRQGTGVDRFAFELLHAWWPKYGHGRHASVAIPTPKGEAPNHGVRDLGLSIPLKQSGGLQGHPWEQLKLPILSRDSLLLSLCNSGPIMHRRQIVVMHDAAVLSRPASYSFAYRNWHRWLMTHMIKSVGVVATVSKFSAMELKKYFPRQERDFEVIYEGGEHILREPADQSVLERLKLGGRRFVLAVGSRSANKNLVTVIKAAALLKDLDVAVVAAGGSNDRIFNGIDTADSGIILAGYVTDGELRALYQSAECFIFPSFYEGFGLPPLEAMHCGCPVVASNRASMPEVCGDAALYFDPDDFAGAATQLRKILGSSNLRAEMREAGFLQAGKFSWSNAADKFENLIASRLTEVRE